MDCRFVEESFKAIIKDGFAILSWPDGDRCSVPLRVLRQDIEYATQLLADYDAKSADVISINRKAKP